MPLFSSLFSLPPMPQSTGMVVSLALHAAVATVAVTCAFTVHTADPPQGSCGGFVTNADTPLGDPNSSQQTWGDLPSPAGLPDAASAQPPIPDRWQASLPTPPALIADAAPTFAFHSVPIAPRIRSQFLGPSTGNSDHPSNSSPSASTGRGTNTSANPGTINGTGSGFGGSPTGTALAGSDGGLGTGPSGSSHAPVALAGNPAPAYPDLARRRGYHGSVRLAYIVLPNGSVGHVKVLASSGYDILDQAALKAVASWHFIPEPALHERHVEQQFDFGLPSE